MSSTIDLKHINAWIFDLDNTLYPYENSLFPQIEKRIRNFVSKTLNVDKDEAHRIQKKYFHAYGTTMLGLMNDHGVDPYAFLEYVHDINITKIQPDKNLSVAIERLPGQKFVFTNADYTYANRVLNRIGFSNNAFDGIFDIESAGWVPKPNPLTYQRMVGQTGINPSKSVFFEDLARNLVPASEMGMTTVWLKNDAEWTDLAAESFSADYVITSLSSWLNDIVEGL